MKKHAIIIAGMLAFAAVAYAACTGSIKSVDNDADVWSDCNNGAGSSTSCTYWTYQPAIESCDTNGWQVCKSTTNKVVIILQLQKGNCDGSGGCANAVPSGPPGATTNTVPELILCGG